VTRTHTGSVDTFAVPTPNANVAGIATGADGNLWFSEYNANKVGRVTPAGSFAEFVLPNPDSNPNILAAVPAATFGLPSTRTPTASRA